MKKRVGELYDKPIVVGNPNEFTKNEIALSDLGGDSFDDGMEYYLVIDRDRLGNNYISFPDNIAVFSTAISNYFNMSKSRIFTKLPPNDICIAFSVSKYDSSDNEYDFDEERCTKNRFITAYNNLSLDDNTLFKRITAKEYYSLLD